MTGMGLSRKRKQGLYKYLMKDAKEHMPATINWEWFQHL
jgi:hypothetical protein